MTLLTIVTEICEEIGIAVPSTIVGSADETAVQMLRLADRAGVELSKRHGWQRMVQEYTFSTVASTASYALPSDIQDPPAFIEDTLWDRTNNRRLKGPTDPQRWQYLQSGISGLAGSVMSFFRVRTNLFYIYPTPSSVRTIAYEYPSINWCESSGGTDQAAWAADTDTLLMPNEIYKLDLIWRFRKAKGLSYAAEYVEAQDAIENAIAKDGGNGIIYLDGDYQDEVLGVNLPEIGYG